MHGSRTVSAIDVDFNEAHIISTINCCIIVVLANNIIVHYFSVNKKSINTPFLS